MPVAQIAGRGEFPILDVIRKGKVLTKARKYFDGNPIIKVTERICELKMNGCLNSGRGFASGLPKPLFNLSKAIMRP